MDEEKVLANQFNALADESYEHLAKAESSIRVIDELINAVEIGALLQRASTEALISIAKSLQAYMLAFKIAANDKEQDQGESDNRAD